MHTSNQDLLYLFQVIFYDINFFQFLKAHSFFVLPFFSTDPIILLFDHGNNICYTQGGR